jgi:hypothetical protein
MSSCTPMRLELCRGGISLPSQHLTSVSSRAHTSMAAPSNNMVAARDILAIILSCGARMRRGVGGEVPVPRVMGLGEQGPAAMAWHQSPVAVGIDEHLC